MNKIVVGIGTLLMACGAYYTLRHFFFGEETKEYKVVMNDMTDEHAREIAQNWIDAGAKNAAWKRSQLVASDTKEAVCNVMLFIFVCTPSFFDSHKGNMQYIENQDCWA